MEVPLPCRTRTRPAAPTQLCPSTNLPAFPAVAETSRLDLDLSALPWVVGGREKPLGICLNKKETPRRAGVFPRTAPLRPHPAPKSGQLCLDRIRRSPCPYLGRCPSPRPCVAVTGSPSPRGPQSSDGVCWPQRPRAPPHPAGPPGGAVETQVPRFRARPVPGRGAIAASLDLESQRTAPAPR